MGNLLVANLPWRGKPDPKEKQNTPSPSISGKSVHQRIVITDLELRVGSQSIYLISGIHERTIILALIPSDVLDTRI